MSEVPVIRKVAWYGTGKLGLPVLKSVASSHQFDITLLIRQESQLSTEIPHGVAIKKIDFDNSSTIVNALLEQDAVVVFTKLAPFSDLDIIQLELIKAAIKAEVKFFVPSEWGPDTVGGNDASIFRIGPDTLPATPVIAPKRVVHNYLLARSAEGKINYATVHTGNMLSSLNVFAAFNFETRTAALPDDGQHPFSVTSKETLGQAVIGLLSRYPRTRNRSFYICDGETSLRKVVRAIEDVSKAPQPWDVSSFSIEDNKRNADENLRNGQYSLQDFVGVLSVPFTGGLTVWKRPDNEILGLPKPTSEAAEKFVRHVATCFLESKEV